jgi:HK97 gp10 family phage protein
MSEITFEGLDETLESLEGLLDEKKVRAALGKACALVEREAKKKAPKGDGTLRRSITSKVLDDYTGEVFTTLEYAPYVEYGTGLFAEKGGRSDVPWCYQDDKGEWHSTSGMKPHPYMRPALNENREEIKRILREGLTKND